MKKSEINVPLSVPKKMQNVYLQNYLKATRDTGKLFLFAGDQKIEHLNKDFFGSGIDKSDADPEHLFKIASQGKVGAFATQLGLISMYGCDYKNVNYIIKLNSKTDLVSVKQKDPISFSLNTVNEVVEFKKNSDLDIVGVGYTIYLGSEFEGQMLAEASRAVLKAHENGFLAILWVYPRGKAVKNETSAEIIAGAAGVAACLGADFVKVNPPTIIVVPKALASKKNAQLLKQAVAAAGKTKVICSGGKQKKEKEFLKEVDDLVNIGGAEGVAIGRNLHQRCLADAVKLCKEIYKILKK